jgi:hypothetical protein
MYNARNRILRCLFDGKAKSSIDIYNETRIFTGTLFPALFALEQEGIIVSEWAEGIYPRLRLYKLAERNPLDVC